MGETPTRFHRYILLEKLFEGSTADVYLSCYQKSADLNRLVVIKRFLHTKKRNIRAFKNEMKILMRLSHPSIVQFFDVGEEKLSPFIEMEYIHGKPLYDVLMRLREQNRELPIELALYIAETSAAVLNYVHSARDQMTGEPLEVVHRDFNPKNLMIGYDGSVKIMGFGFSRFESRAIARRVLPPRPSTKTQPTQMQSAPPDIPDPTNTHTLTGTQTTLVNFQYHSPEQLRKEHLDARSDLYSLGLVLWEMLAGIAPEDRPLPPPSTIRPEVPEALDKIVMQAIAHGAGDRYQVGNDLRQALRRYRLREYPDFEVGGLEAFARSLFAREILGDEARLQKLLSIAMRGEVDQLGAQVSAALVGPQASPVLESSIKTLAISVPEGSFEGTEHLRKLVEEAAKLRGAPGELPRIVQPESASPRSATGMTVVAPFAAVSQSSQMSLVPSPKAGKARALSELALPLDRNRWAAFARKWAKNEWVILSSAVVVFCLIVTPRAIPPTGGPPVDAPIIKAQVPSSVVQLPGNPEVLHPALAAPQPNVPIAPGLPARPVLRYPANSMPAPRYSPAPPSRTRRTRRVPASSAKAGRTRVKKTVKPKTSDR